MTDYLQLLEEETAPALLEQARRLERALSGTTAEPWEEGEASASPFFCRAGQRPAQRRGP